MAFKETREVERANICLLGLIAFVFEFTMFYSVFLPVDLLSSSVISLVYSNFVLIYLLLLLSNMSCFCVL